jgi:hypothetical protein
LLLLALSLSLVISLDASLTTLSLRLFILPLVFGSSLLKVCLLLLLHSLTLLETSSYGSASCALGRTLQRTTNSVTHTLT